jgi:dienelactone hydrolase
MRSRSVQLVLLTPLLLLRVFPALAAAGPEAELDLPRPNSTYPVGLSTIVLRDHNRTRDLLVTMWYPALGGKAAFAPYMDPRTADAVAENWNLTPHFERRVHTHSTTSAPIAQGDPFPVVLLEHGSGVVPALYTVLAEGLASSGFVVIATNHPHDSLIAVFPDGHEIVSAPYWPLDADRRTQGVAIGKFASDVLVPDVRFVLDHLGEMNARTGSWRGRLDLSKVGIVGHSMGGTTAALATRQEARILAGVNLDGSTWPGMNADVRPVELHKPLLFLATEEHAADPNTHAREYIGTKSNTYYVVLAGADHLSFTDVHLLEGRFARGAKPEKGAIAHALLASEMTRSLVEAFFCKYLKAMSAPELDQPVRVERE